MNFRLRFSALLHVVEGESVSPQEKKEVQKTFKRLHCGKGAPSFLGVEKRKEERALTLTVDYIREKEARKRRG